MKQTKTKIKVIFAWQEEKESKWLNEMSQKGWHLISVGIYIYKFIKGEPTDFVYRFDYNPMKKIDRDEYLQIFADAGWTLIDNIAGWFYFRTKKQNEKTPEIYTDNKSQIKKYKRLLLTMCLVALPSISLIILYFTEVYKHKNWSFLAIFMLGVVTGLMHTFFKVLSIIKNLKKNDTVSRN